MVVKLKPGWSKPSTILFAADIPANPKAFAFALAQAREFRSDLILFHVDDSLMVAAAQDPELRYYDYAAATRGEKQHLESLAETARGAGLRCEVVVRPGLPADRIRAFARERQIDRIVMGTHSPGPIGKLLVGSVAEAVLRTAEAPVYIVGPEVVDGSYRNFATRAILCAVSLHEASRVVAAFAAELAAEHSARLILQHVIRHDGTDSRRAAGAGTHPDGRGARRSYRGTALPEPRPAGRFDRPGRSGSLGVCRHHKEWSGL
jgi:nucleotide-binding universal stress UspA family protein